MDSSFTRKIDATCFRASESEAKLGLADLSCGQFSRFKGKLTGPRCAFARTLPATFSIPECVCQVDAAVMAQQQITDPCYWTPRLPYLYDFEIELECQDGSVTSSQHTLGLRRWEINDRNFLLERKRTVLRGVVAGPESNVELTKAHDVELCVLVTDPSETFLQQASTSGVMVVAEIRGSEESLTQQLLSFTWQPSVALVIPDMEACYVPYSQTLSANVSSATNFSPEVCNADHVKAVFVELGENERPPRFLKEFGKPVIAIRRGVEFSDLHAARAACDKLQAELAPEFDLAGYFVAP